MAGSIPVARRYAEAYFALARDRGDIEGWRRELVAAEEILTHPEVAAALVNPRVRRDERLRLVLTLLDGASPAVRNLVRLLVERKRARLAPLILAEFERLADRTAGVIRAEVTTATEITRDLEEQVSGTLRERIGGDVRTVVSHDPGILGGLVIRIGDRVIDDSVRTRLQQLQAALAGRI
jgi:F-type H+-transporting ATPase subunit delta